MPPQGRSSFTQMPSRGTFNPSSMFGNTPGIRGGFPGGQMGQFGQQAARSGGLKGILSKFMKPTGAAQGTGIASGGFSGAGLTNTLGNVQQVMKMAQSATPIIREYGPMVKNIPTMVRMIKAFNEADDEEEETTSETSETSMDTDTKSHNKVEFQKESLSKMEVDAKTYKQQKKTSPKKQNATITGTSQPKLFI